MMFRGVQAHASRSARPPQARRRRWFADRSEKSLGQSLVEFALVVPVMLLLTLIAVDFGRIYLGWINLQNAARSASNFAANNPEAWLTADAATITEYRNQVINDTAATNCVLTPAVPADPTFTDGNGDGTATAIGDRVTASFTCTFRLITPIISSILGQNINVSASAAFPVKNGQFAAAGGGGAGPTASFTGSPTTTTTGTNVIFDSSSSTGSPTTWAWTFGDGGTSSAQSPSHPYNAAGTYTVALTVTNANGSNTQTRTNYITVSSPAPVANFTASTTTPATGQTVTFTDTSTGSPTAWTWNFGEGGPVIGGSTASHAYATAGTYTVSLTVTGPGGTNSITKTNYIIVSAATCNVPNFVGMQTKINGAQALWGPGAGTAGFTTTIQEAAGHPGGNYKITFQSIVGGQNVACNSIITVNG